VKRTFCDVDGKQCVNTTVIVRIEVRHHTKDGKTVGEDYFKPIEICTDCEDVLKRIMPQAFIMDGSRSDEMPSRDEVMMAEAPPPIYTQDARERDRRNGE
jgi:hypothetical protein